MMMSVSSYIVDSLPSHYQSLVKEHSILLIQINISILCLFQERNAKLIIAQAAMLLSQGCIHVTCFAIMYFIKYVFDLLASLHNSC